MAKKKNQSTPVSNFIFLIVSLAAIFAISTFVMSSARDVILSYGNYPMDESTVPESDIITVDPGQNPDNEEDSILNPLQDLGNDVDPEDLNILDVDSTSGEWGSEESDSTTTPERKTPTSPTKKRKKSTITRDVENREEVVKSRKYIKLPTPSKTGRIGKSGLKPGTQIAVIKQKASERNGYKLRYNACTVAFSVKGIDKYPWAITAGHCGKVGQKVYSQPDEKTGKSHFLGTIRVVSELNSEKHTGDWAAIRLYPKAQIPNAPQGIPLKLLSGDVPVGTTVCKYGSTTGKGCGKKNNEDTLVTFTNAKTQVETSGILDSATMCSLPGDSGSPVYTKSGIIGILSSTSASKADMAKGTCPSRNETYYTPIDDVIRQIRKNAPDVLF